MSYRVGLVGKPSGGKSTLCNAATMNEVPEGAYRFTTIDPNVGEASVRVSRLRWGRGRSAPNRGLEARGRPTDER